MKILLSIIVFGCLVYGLLCLYLYFNQERLIFFPPGANNPAYQHWQQHAQPLQINGHTLHGWKVVGRPGSDNVIIYFGGNAEDVVYNLEDAEKYSASYLFFSNYRGYGKSTGTPSQQALYKDALSLFDNITSSHQLADKHIFIVGRSLGSAVASYVASQRNISGLILVTPFDSLANVAASYYPWFPVHWLLKHRFDNLDVIQNVTAPILILAADRDGIIPQSNLDNLYRTAMQKTSRQNSSLPGIQLITLPNTNHQTISVADDYYSSINDFMAAQGPAQ